MNYYKFRLDYDRVGFPMDRLLVWVNKNIPCSVITYEVSDTGKKHVHGYFESTSTQKKLSDNLKYAVGKTTEEKWYSMPRARERHPFEYLCYMLKGSKLDEYTISYQDDKLVATMPKTLYEYHETYWSIDEKIRAKRFAKKAITMSVPAQISLYIDNCTQYNPKKDDDLMDAIVDYIYGITKKPTMPPNIMGHYFAVKYNYRPDLVRKRFRRMRQKYDPEAESDSD